MKVHPVAGMEESEICGKINIGENLLRPGKRIGKGITME